jgi:hypothetical protein
MSNEINEVLPSVESLTELGNDMNAALTLFKAANPNVSNPFLCMGALYTMFAYPYMWLAQNGQQERFVELMSLEANNYMNNKKLETSSSNG